MKYLITLTLCVSLALSISAQSAKERSEHYFANVDLANSDSNKKITPRAYVPRSGARGGGGNASDCFGFVDIPEDAILLDPTNPDFSTFFDVDVAWGPIPLDFDYCFFGEEYDEFYINVKGNITFGEPSTAFLSTSFPINNFPMIAGFWADVDISCGTCGEVYYWTTPTAAYITYVDVGYYLDGGNLGNTFQIVITDQSDPVVGIGNNTGLFYQDMQWTSGIFSGGVGGFGGTTPATVGANQSDGLNFIQFGRFIEDSDNYDGPFAGDDGVHWLDDQAFTFNLCSNLNNVPPISNNLDACDTVFVCQNDTHEFDISFLPPEALQTVTVTVDDSDADGWQMTDSGDGFMTGVFTGGPDNIGSHTLTFTATDDGTPTGITAVSYNIEVLDIVLPELTVSGDGFEEDVISYCGGSEGATLNASDGFDSYFWTDGEEEQTGTLEAGEYIVSAYLSGCEANYGPITVLEVPVFNPDVTPSSPTVCEGESTFISVDQPDLYPGGVSWVVVEDADGNILSDDPNQTEIEVEEGIYEVTVINEDGCEGKRIVPVTLEEISVPSMPVLDCEDKEVCWSGAWADPQECSHALYLYDSGADTWEGANLAVYIDGIGPLNYNISNGATFLPTGIIASHNQTITYEFSGGLDDDEIRIQIYNCSNDLVYDSDLPEFDLVEGQIFTQVAETELSTLTGTWTSSNPNGAFEFPTNFNPAEGTNCYSVPSDHIGTDVISFSADICPLTLDYEILFSEPVQLSIDESDFNGCSDDCPTVAPDVFPSEAIDPCELDWTPNFDCEGDPECQICVSANYSVEATNSCGSDEIDGTVEITPVPDAQLEDYTLCTNESQVLNPIEDEHPSYVYTWSNGSDQPQITVTDAGPNGDGYSVTVTNSCGTSEAQVSGQLLTTPTVSPWSVLDTLICPGEDIFIDPNWNDLNGTYVWTMNYVDDNGTNQSEVLSETGPVLNFASEDFPGETVTDVVLSYEYTVPGCGTAEGSVIAYTSACFVAAANVFTPDGDGGENGIFAGGLNEGWHIIGIDGVPNVVVKVYDRWGGLVYESDSYNNDDPWRGKGLNGDDLTEGVYFYTIVTPRGTQEIQGTVTLLRNN